MGWSPTVKSLVRVKNRRSNIIIFGLFVILFLDCNLSGAEDVSQQVNVNEKDKILY